MKKSKLKKKKKVLSKLKKIFDRVFSDLLKRYDLTNIK